MHLKMDFKKGKIRSTWNSAGLAHVSPQATRHPSLLLDWPNLGRQQAAPSPFA